MTQPANLWDMRSDKYRDQSDVVHPSCEICGKKVNPETAMWVEVDTSGRILTWFAPGSSDPNIVAGLRNTQQSQGEFPVGPECAKKVLEAIKAAHVPEVSGRCESCNGLHSDCGAA